MILIKNLQKVIDENTTEPIEKGGELEKYLSEATQAFLAQNFGIISEVQINK